MSPAVVRAKSQPRWESRCRVGRQARPTMVPVQTYEEGARPRLKPLMHLATRAKLNRNPTRDLGLLLAVGTAQVPYYVNANEEERVTEAIRNPYRFTLRAPLDVLYQPTSTRREIKKVLLPGVQIVIPVETYIVTYRSIEYVGFSVNDEPWYYAQPLDILKAVG